MFGIAVAQVYIRHSRGGQSSNPGRSLWDFSVEKFDRTVLF